MSVEHTSIPLRGPKEGELFVQHMAGIRNASAAEVIDLLNTDLRRDPKAYARLYDLSQIVLSRLLKEVYPGEKSQNNQYGLDIENPLFEEALALGRQAIVNATSSWQPGESKNYYGHVRAHIIVSYSDKGLPVPNVSSEREVE